MKIKRNKKGFTLLEIMIVVIIVGVLAALALPRLFGTIEYSRSTEALNSMASIRSSFERCYLQDRSFSECDGTNGDFSVLDIENPEDSPGAHFAYTLYRADANGFIVIAKRNTTDGGTATDCIGLIQEGNSITRCGTGSFQKLGPHAACTAADATCTN